MDVVEDAEDEVAASEDLLAQQKGMVFVLQVAPLPHVAICTVSAK